MTDNELIYKIWGIDPLKKQFEIAPYSLTLGDTNFLKNQEFFEIAKIEGLNSQSLTRVSEHSDLEVTISKSSSISTSQTATVLKSYFYNRQQTKLGSMVSLTKI